MSKPSYLDFDLAVQREADGYRARVLHSPGGEGAGLFRLPFSDLEIENLLLRMGQSRARTRGDSKQMQAAKKIGGELFNAVFTGDVARCWQTSLAKSDAQNLGLRLRLRLNDVPELADLPWELLYDPSLNRFFTQSTQTPIIRFLDLPAPPRPLAIQPPLRILVMISLPSDVEELDADQEWNNLNQALAELRTKGIIELERMDEAALPALQRKFRQGEYHVLHFIGHGDFDARRDESVLLFEGERGHARQVGGQMLGTLLYDHKSLRFVFLNACEGARAGRADPFSGIAQSLIRQGIPAIVAMQFPISDGAALVFSREVYTALADNYPLDAALSEARKAIYLSGNEVEWATPVLYSRAPDGVLFDVQAISRAPASAEVPKAETREFDVSASGGNSSFAFGKTFDELLERALRAQKQADRILEDSPNEPEAYLPKYREAYDLLQRADAQRPETPRALLSMAQVLVRLSPDNLNQAKQFLREAESLLAEPRDDDERRLAADAYLFHATLSDPPDGRLLERAETLYDELHDRAMLRRIDSIRSRTSRPTGSALRDYYDESPTGGEFNPLGRWNIQVQDMVGTRYVIEFAPNGTYQMIQQVGTYQIPANGTWTFDTLTRRLALHGVVSTFQPFVLAITITGKLPNGFTATSGDGIGYRLTRA